jgi:REP element-mobilizing transposase RayT
MDRAQVPNRRSIRLHGFDYAQNAAYVVTICAAQRLCLFGAIETGEMQLSPVGQVVDSMWQGLPDHTPDLSLDAWVVMPNHLHGIIVLPGATVTRVANDGHPRGPASASLGAVIGGVKSAVSRRVAAENLSLVRPIWQRNYYERIIRNDRELDAIRRYVADNPARWNDDSEHPRLHASTKETNDL